MGDDIVEDALDSGDLYQQGPHYYADPDHEEHVATGKEDAAAYLRDGNATSPEEDQQETVYDSDAKYRFEGETWTEVDRPGRGPALLHPGCVYTELPDCEGVRELIQEGLLVDISN